MLLPFWWLFVLSLAVLNMVVGEKPVKFPASPATPEKRPGNQIPGDHTHPIGPVTVPRPEINPGNALKPLAADEPKVPESAAKPLAVDESKIPSADAKRPTTTKPITPVHPHVGVPQAPVVVNKELLPAQVQDPLLPTTTGSPVLAKTGQPTNVGEAKPYIGVKSMSKWTATSLVATATSDPMAVLEYQECVNFQRRCNNLCGDSLFYATCDRGGLCVCHTDRQVPGEESVSQSTAFRTSWSLWWTVPGCAISILVLY
ncbi:hypothetical protein IWQ62_005831 [Dispira parvispora]|uniref:Uncharacterized protein n=1 Tax=Dispira parvispora TaxID=1520584 RepID=A0A9W8AJM4_9FUNG|nr:hypothetical protein IWQ62_005831 [Dispira parvispora]